VSGISLDFKLGLRMLAKYPGLTLVGGLGLAVAIAISASLFSVLGVVAESSLPLDGDDRIVAIQDFNAATGDDDPGTHLHDLAEWRRELRAVGELGAYRTVDRNLVTGEGPPEPLRIVEMTASGFRIAGVPPLLGRQLDEADERAGAAPVVVIGHDLWQRRFAGDPGVVGRTIRLGRDAYDVVGVMPEGFGFPINNRVWTPLRLDPLDFERGRAPAIEVFGRLAPGATLVQAQAQLTAIGQRMASAYPATHEHIRPRVLPYARSFLDTPQLAWLFYLFQLLVGLLLVVIAINVAILVYARTATRKGEIAVRLALGASRVRVVIQLFAEALVLSAFSAVVGLLAARYALGQIDAVVDRLGGEEVPFWWDFRLSPGTVAYATGLAVVAAAVVGVVPALKATGRRVQSTLREAGGGTGMRMGRTWTTLIVAQVAVAVAMVPPVAVPLGQYLVSTSRPDPAVPAGELLIARLALDHPTTPGELAPGPAESQARLAERYAELARRLELEPGVVGVSVASGPPGAGAVGHIEMEGARPGSELTTHSVSYQAVGAGMFDLLEAPMLAGRGFSPGEFDGSATAVVVNLSFVNVELGGGRALGRRLRYTRGAGTPGESESGGWYEIVGVVGDLYIRPSTPQGDAVRVYHPLRAGAPGASNLVVRVRGVAPEAVATRVREIAAAIDPTLRVTDALSLPELHRLDERPGRLAVLAFGGLVLSVLLFSMAGVHALLSFTVAQRRKEIGIRTALGARPRQVLGSIFSRVLWQIGLGVGIGGLLAGMMIVELTTTTGRAILTTATVAALMLAVGLLAAFGPARRGLRVQPMEALREE
jgi:predicted permease